MSTAWYKPNRFPRKIRSWTTSSLGTTPRKRNPPGLCRSIEVWETTCVVTNMNSRESGNDSETPFSVLINPGNPSLSGVSKFAYFPVGGPEPPPSFQIGKDSHPIMGYVTTWGGMEVGQGMAFASNTVDGMVHQYGGKDLQKECQAALGNTWWFLGAGRNKPLLEEGQAVSTPAVGPKLKEASGYDLLVHTVPPFCGQDYRSQPQHKREDDSAAVQQDETERGAVADHNNFLLAECYRNSLRMATLSQSQSPLLKIACPLLGAGCRGFPVERAINVAAKSTTQWMMQASTWNGTGGNTTNNTGTRNDSFRSSLWNGWFGGGSDNNGASLECPDKSLQQPSITLAFGIPDGEIRQKLIEAIDREMKKVQAP